MQLKSIKNFTVKFFESLNCSLSWNENVLVVGEVPPKFEKFVGKLAPYRFVFDPTEKKEGLELLSKGSFFLRAMSEWLASGTKTSLVKLNLESKPEEIIERYFSFENTKISRIDKSHKNDYIMTFTFLTTFQYLNKKEQLTNSITVYNGVLINFDLGKYKFSQGKKEDIVLEETDKDYKIAKMQLRELLKKRTAKIGEMLNIRLQKELDRLDAHYLNQINEIEDQVVKLQNQIIKLNKELVKEPSEKNRKKLERAKEALKIINKKNEKPKLEKEKRFFISDERNKHSLNINTKLMNTTIIYYPKLSFKLKLRRKDQVSMIKEIKYNPLVDRISSIFCDCCDKDIKSIFVCPSGHVSCKKCLTRCPFCEEVLCKKCTKTKCLICGRGACNNCISKCQKCKKDVCINHLRITSSGKKYCVNCLKKCATCLTSVEEKELGKCSFCGREVCQKCLRKGLSDGKFRVLCKNCLEIH